MADTEQLRGKVDGFDQALEEAEARRKEEDRSRREEHEKEALEEREVRIRRDRERLEMESRLNKKLDKLAELKSGGSGAAGVQGSTAAAAVREIGALFAAEDPNQRFDDLHAQVRNSLFSARFVLEFSPLIFISRCLVK